MGVVIFAPTSTFIGSEVLTAQKPVHIAHRTWVSSLHGSEVETLGYGSDPAKAGKQSTEKHTSNWVKKRHVAYFLRVN
eukprot:4174829-Prymnesium_polylepis.1